ncbi:MAG: hemolysin family protein [Kofleriaceae bacterium]
MLTELLIVLALVLANGLFAGAEIALLSVRNSKVQDGKNRRDRRAFAVQALRDQPERFLATVQIGITVIGSAAAAFGGASIAQTLTPVMERVFGKSGEQVAFALVIIAISFLSLVLGELVPKSLALRYSDHYAFFVSRPLLALAKIARPLVWFLTWCSNLVLRLFGDRTSFTESRVSRDELKQLVVEAARTGSLDPKSSEIAARALELGDVAVAEVMVRRDRIVGIPHTAGPDEVQRVLLEEGHSRMPVYEGELDRVIGYVVARDVLAVAWERGLVVLSDIVRPVFTVPVTARINVVLREMQARRIQIAMVVDEAGGVAGLVTMEDLVEELVGDIFGEHDTPDEIVHLESAHSALVAGWVPIRKVNRLLDTALPIARDSTTIAGLCMSLALAIPPVGARLPVHDGTVIEVVDASPRRVRMVRIHHHQRRAEDELEPGAEPQREAASERETETA